MKAVNDRVEVSDIIGRALCVQKATDQSICDNSLRNNSPLGKENNDNSKQSEEPWVCGVIARAAGIFENKKKICACSGKTIWDESQFY